LRLLKIRSILFLKVFHYFLVIFLKTLLLLFFYRFHRTCFSMNWTLNSQTKLQIKFSIKQVFRYKKIVGFFNYQKIYDEPPSKITTLLINFNLSDLPGRVSRIFTPPQSLSPPPLTRTTHKPDGQSLIQGHCSRKRDWISCSKEFCQRS
jgi:hypothetical protein